MEKEYVDIIADHIIRNLTDAHTRLSQNLGAGEVKDLIRLSRFLMDFVKEYRDVRLFLNFGEDGADDPEINQPSAERGSQ